MREIGLAMLSIKEHAKEWLVDADRIAICGFSAGAHNCAMYATHWHLPVITDYFGKDKELFDAANLSYLGGKEVSEEQLMEVSPARFVTEETPPTFLWATAEDEVVPVQHSIRMANALADGGVPFELHIFEEGRHGLSLATQASSGCKAQVNKDAAKWIGLADAWLHKRFAIEFEN